MITARELRTHYSPLMRSTRTGRKQDSMTTRTDPRYVASDDPAAVLRAWGGESAQHATMDMGGWTDTDEAAFRAAVQDESTQMAGEPLDYISIERVPR